MSKIDKDIIGEGGFGCVYKPALDYENDDKSHIDYDVSKVQTEEHTNNELEQYINIDRIDPEYKYHLTHFSCVPKKHEVYNIRKCRHFSKVKMSDVKKLRLIQMPYGGTSIKNVLKLLDTDSKKSQTININEFGTHFLKSFINLFEGIKLFNENGFMHYDIKPGNILYDMDKKKFSFIDFGLSIMKDKILENINTHFLPWGYYPLDTVFYDKDIFIKCKNYIIDKPDKNRCIAKIRYEIISKFNNGTRDSFKENVIGMIYHEKNCDKEYEFYNTYLNNFIESFIDFNINGGSKTYEDYMEISTSKLDVYSLGLVLKRLIIVFFSLRYFFNANLNLLKCYGYLMELADKMITYDFIERLTPEKALEEYKNILDTYMNDVINTPKPRLKPIKNRKYGIYKRYT